LRQILNISRIYSERTAAQNIVLFNDYQKILWHWYVFKQKKPNFADSYTYFSLWLSSEGISGKIPGVTQYWKPISISLFNPINIRIPICLLKQNKQKTTAWNTEIFRHSVSPCCISTTCFRYYNWESNSDSRPLPHWLEQIGLCISGDVLSYFKIPKRALIVKKKQNKYELLICI
jgi:hypothetical protein